MRASRRSRRGSEWPAPLPRFHRPLPPSSLHRRSMHRHIHQRVPPSRTRSSDHQAQDRRLNPTLAIPEQTPLHRAKKTRRRHRQPPGTQRFSSSGQPSPRRQSRATHHQPTRLRRANPAHHPMLRGGGAMRSVAIKNDRTTLLIFPMITSFLLRTIVKTEQNHHSKLLHLIIANPRFAATENPTRKKRRDRKCWDRPLLQYPKRA